MDELTREFLIESQEGQETEFDKSLLEAIKDPLTHALRNALDHGIEPPEGRNSRQGHRTRPHHARSRDIRIEGTDICADVVAHASAGRYQRIEINRGPPARFEVRYFDHEREH